jgi:hypothetical protein
MTVTSTLSALLGALEGHDLAPDIHEAIADANAALMREADAGPGVRDLDAIRARDTDATPGPWGWYGNVDTRTVALVARTSGLPFVMGFERWGMQDARPSFCYRNEAGARAWVMAPVDGGNVVYEVDRNATDRKASTVYRGDIVGIRNPDAEFIAHARQDVTDLLAEVERLRAERSEHAAEIGRLTAEVERQKSKANALDWRLHHIINIENGDQPDHICNGTGEPECPGCWWQDVANIQRIARGDS